MLDYFKINLASKSKGHFTDLFDDIFHHVRSTYPSLARISIARLECGKLSTYHTADISQTRSQLEFKEVALLPGSSIDRMMKTRQFRLINNISLVRPTGHTQMLKQAGYMSSLAFPIVHRDEAVGVMFFNAKEEDYFSSTQTQRDFCFVSSVLSALFISTLERRINFERTLKVALKMGHDRDPETAQHLTRMGKYSETLSRILAAEYPEITTEFIHRIRFYAPFHDIGKYRIPDEILFSERKFTEEEREIMNMHTVYGERIIDEVVSVCDTEDISSDEIQFLKNIVRHHHETFDGAGHPDQLSGDLIPLEARIVTLADVFDALLSARPYKKQWTLESALDFIVQKTHVMFDPACVKALMNNIEEFIRIKNRFEDRSPLQYEELPAKAQLGSASYS